MYMAVIIVLLGSISSGPVCLSLAAVAVNSLSGAELR